MSFFPSSLENLIDAFASLPGIGKTSPAKRPMMAPHEAYLLPPVILVNQAGTT